MSSDNLKLICRDWLYNKCARDNCKFIHDLELCIDYVKSNKCNGSCGKNHFVNPELVNQFNSNKQNKSRKNINSNPNQNNKQINNNKPQPQHQHHHHHHKSKPINTEKFEPDFTPPEMRILFEYGLTESNGNPQSNDVLIVPDLFAGESNLFAGESNLYERLLDELFATNFNKHELVISWHEGCHLIADDKLDWKKYCPTFNYVIDKVAKYFKMDVKATRFNWMQNLNDHKFFHYDGAALKPEIAKKQNSTIGVSFGATRDIAFQVASHPNCRKVVSIPLPNGYTYCFNKDVNIDWRHGVLPIETKPDYKPNRKDGRVSIVAWGYIDQVDIKPNNHI